MLVIIRCCSGSTGERLRDEEKLLNALATSSQEQDNTSSDGNDGDGTSDGNEDGAQVVEIMMGAHQVEIRHHAGIAY